MNMEVRRRQFGIVTLVTMILCANTCYSSTDPDNGQYDRTVITDQSQLHQPLYIVRRTRGAMQIEAPDDPHTRLSYQCVVYEIAESNNVSVVYRFQDKVGGIDGKNFTYRLNIGNEEYFASGLSKRLSQESVSEQATKMTKYRRPAGVHRRCLNTYTAMALVHEWAQKQRRRIEYITVGQDAGDPPNYVIECYIEPNLRTRAQASEKKEAKLQAAELMLRQLQAPHLQAAIPPSVRNATYMHPVSRLYEIQMTTTQQEPIYELKAKYLGSDNMGHRFTDFLLEVRVANLTAHGSGRTIKEAKREASTAMLMLLGYDVDLL